MAQPMAIANKERIGKALDLLRDSSSGGTVTWVLRLWSARPLPRFRHCRRLLTGGLFTLTRLEIH